MSKYIQRDIEELEQNITIFSPYPVRCDKLLQSARVNK